jgi:iron complex transport system ATP-binding protein
MLIEWAVYKVDWSDGHMETRPCVKVRELPIELSGNLSYSSLNFEIRCGQLAVITGAHSPAWGMLLHMMAGIQPIHAGSIELWGYPVAAISRRDMNSEVCYIPNKHKPVFNYSVKDYVLQGCEAKLKPLQTLEEAASQRAMQILGRLQIEKLSSRNSEYLTNSEHQKVHLARAFVQNARLMILDEPVDCLDETDQYGVMTMLLENARQFHQTVVAAMQDPHLGLLLADQLIILDQNGIVADLDRRRPDFAAAAELALSKALPFSPDYKHLLGFDLSELKMANAEPASESGKYPKGSIF